VNIPANGWVIFVNARPSFKFGSIGSLVEQQCDPISGELRFEFGNKVFHHVLDHLSLS
jgi:hypothetical protein